VLNGVPQKLECEDPWKIIDPPLPAVPDPEMLACPIPITADPPVREIVVAPRASDPEVRVRVYPSCKTPVTVKTMVPAAGPRAVGPTFLAKAALVDLATAVGGTFVVRFLYSPWVLVKVTCSPTVSAGGWGNWIVTLGGEVVL
jgi:hypothetical protein